MDVFFDWNDDLLKEYNTIWDKISAPKVDSNHTCLAIIRLDTAFNKDGNCKYIEKRVIKHINDNLSNFSSFDYSDDSDEE